MTVMKTQGIQQAPTYGPGYGLHTISDVDHEHHGKNDHATQTAQPERKSNWLCSGRKKRVTGEEGYGKIKLHHLHCHSELLLQETVYP